MGLTFSYKDFWMWHAQVSEEQKAHAWQELIKDDWLANLPVELQVEVLRHAPIELLTSMKYFPDIFKYETIVILDKELQKKNKIEEPNYRKNRKHSIDYTKRGWL
jgi:hypothetical protein